MTRLSHTQGKKIQYFMYNIKDLHFHIQFYKVKNSLYKILGVQSFYISPSVQLDHNRFA